MATGDQRNTRRFRKLRDEVVREEPECRLRRTGCTFVSTTADHIVPYRRHPDLCFFRPNLRGSCDHCNKSRQDDPDPAAEGPVWEALQRQAIEDSAQGRNPHRPRALDIFVPLPSLTARK